MANQVFSPSADEVKEAQEITEAMALANQKGKSVTTLHGRMTEELHLRRARRVLELADIEADTKK